MPLQVTLFYVDTSAKEKAPVEITMFAVDAREAMHNAPGEYFPTIEAAQAACVPALKIKGSRKAAEVLAEENAIMSDETQA